MARLSHRDLCGFLIAAVITTAPLLVAVAFTESMSKEGFSGPRVYILTGVVGVLAAVPASAAALLLARGSRGHLGYYVMFGVLVSLVTFLVFCTIIVPEAVESGLAYR